MITPINDISLAYNLAGRLNRLIKSAPEVLPLINALIETRVNVPESLADHPTIQVCQLNDGVEDFYQVGFLGLLNGLIGAQPDNVEKAAWGYLMLVDDEKFTVTSNKVTVDELMENPRPDVMYTVEGTVSSLVPMGLSGERHFLKFRSFGKYAVDEKATLYGKLGLVDSEEFFFQCMSPYPD